jgi:hypothetical protein
MTPLAEQAIVDIIATEMRLNSQNMWVRDQNLKIPNTKELYVVAGMVDSRVISVNRDMANVVSPDTLQQNMMVVTKDNIQIDIFSATTEAITRRWEVLAALAIYSVQKQEENQFKIFRVPSNFVNTSGAEGGSNLNRFSITISCHVWYRKETVLSRSKIFDTFETRVDDESTIGQDNGLFDFTITEGFEP